MTELSPIQFWSIILSLILIISLLTHFIAPWFVPESLRVVETLVGPSGPPGHPGPPGPQGVPGKCSCEGSKEQSDGDSTATTKDHAFDDGEIVQLKTGGPLMIVSNLFPPSPSTCDVTWSVDGIIQRARVAKTSLVLKDRPSSSTNNSVQERAYVQGLTTALTISLLALRSIKFDGVIYTEGDVKAKAYANEKEIKAAIAVASTWINSEAPNTTS